MQHNLGAAPMRLEFVQGGLSGKGIRGPDFDSQCSRRYFSAIFKYLPYQ